MASTDSFTGASGTRYVRDGLTVKVEGDDTPMISFSDPEDFETAADEADEEMRCLIADARREFGF